MRKKNDAVKNQNFCKYCDKIIIGSSYKFKSHLFKHNAVEARFKCKYCSKPYYRYDTFIRHERGHIGVKKNEKVYVCDYCDRPFVNKYNLIVHLKKIHDDSINPNLVEFPCTVCGVQYCEKRILDQHIRKVHLNVKSQEEPTHLSEAINENWIKQVIGTDNCVLITKIHNNAITIKKCGKTKDSKKHIETKQSQGNQIIDQYSKAICDYCKKEMIKKSLNNHIRECHLNIRKYKCVECNRSFKRHYQFVDHKCKLERRSKKTKRL